MSIDTSKMSPEAYKAFTDAKAMGKESPRKCGQCVGDSQHHASDCPTQKPFKCPACGNCQTGDGVCARCAFAGKESVVQPSQAQFKPGDTVWHREKKLLAGSVIAQDGNWLWIRRPEGRYVAAACDFVTTDPNAEPEPQKCPFCGCTARIIEINKTAFRAACDRMGECFFESPIKLTRLEAIQAWNSIRVGVQIKE